MVAVPSPNDAIEAELLGVSCPSTTTCFAAGDYESPASGGALLEQWNGTSWSIVEGSDSTQAVRAHVHLRVRRSVGFDVRHPVGSAIGPGADAPIAVGPIFGFETTPGLEDVSCSSPTSCFAVGVSFVGALAERWDGTVWTIVDTPTPHDSVGADLAGVSCVNSTDCSAVGASQLESVSGDVTEVGSVPLAEHWNGTSWTVEAEPSGVPVTPLTGVSCPTSTSCAAVGATSSIQQWNGTSWSIAPMSNKSSESQLVSVSCPSADRCFAVGLSSSNTQGNALIELWNGTRWSVVPSPNLTGLVYAELSGVSCSSATNCLAVGSVFSPAGENGLVERWNGTRWSIITPSNPTGAQFVQFSGASCSTATTCFAVGSDATDTAEQALVELWNGARWSTTPSPIPTGVQNTQLNAVSCQSATDCTAVGSGEALAGSRLPGVRTFIEHWNGTSWTVATSANPTGLPLAALVGVSCSTSTNCVAVGIDASSTTAASKPLAEDWNGNTWTLAAVPNPNGAANTELLSVSCHSSNSCYAVGGYSTSTTSNTLVEHWNGTSWSQVGDPNPAGANGASLSGVSCPSPTSCTAVGSYSAHDSSFTLAELGS
ncbi:MAG: hypothetical protein ACLPVY_23295 [Acidimicrobiia bacterium]